MLGLIYFLNSYPITNLQLYSTGTLQLICPSIKFLGAKGRSTDQFQEQVPAVELNLISFIDNEHKPECIQN